MILKTLTGSDKVEEYRTALWHENKDYLKVVDDLLSNKEVIKMSEITHHHFTDRLEHSITVSYKSYLLAKKLNLDYVSTARAGLLHDFFLLDREEISRLKQGPHSSVHPKLALENAERITSINKIEKDIILKHMFGATLSFPKYKESYVVTIIDKYVAVSEVFPELGRILKYRMFMLLITSTMLFVG